MTHPVTIRRVVLDFDGTCTQIPLACERYSAEYRSIFSSEVSPTTEAEWRAVESEVRRQSPEAAWMLGGAPSAPAAADPYILAYETAHALVRRREITTPIPTDLHARSYAVAPAPWRAPALDVLTELLARGVELAFISNSQTKEVEGRVRQLLGEKRDHLHIEGNAAKFRIRELTWDTPIISEEMRSAFWSLLPGASTPKLHRPIYLRRGAYLEAIVRALGDDRKLLESTLFCGDIWELDLSMPAELGACVHLIDRQDPFPTYDYELEELQKVGARGKRSADLDGLLSWF